MKVLRCAVCGKELTVDDDAIKISEVWNLDPSEGYICDDPSCAYNWLIRDCPIVYIGDEWRDEIEPYLEDEAEEASEDNLTSEEIADVEEAWDEIEMGEAKKFTNVEEFLRDLKRLLKVES